MSMLDLSQLGPEKVRPIKRVEYDQMVESGYFDDERIELLRGALVEMTPQGPRHSNKLRQLMRLFGSIPEERAAMLVQMPLAVSEDSEPEPDLALVPPGDYSEAHPTTALLVIEVADSSRRKDRQIKPDLYAGANVPEYWLVDLTEGVVEVRSEPDRGRYRKLVTYDGGTLHPASFPEIAIDVGELFGPAEKK